MRSTLFRRTSASLTGISLLLMVTPHAFPEVPSVRPSKTASHAQSDDSKKKSAVPESLEIESFTEPWKDISVAASEMGTVSRMEVQEGALVKAGDLLAALDDQVLRAGLEVARRSMNAVGTLRSAQADVTMRKTELDKLTQLRERNHASQREVDRVIAELEMAEARVQSVQEELELKQLEARRIEAQIEQRLVRSPIDGIVTEVFRETGEFVSPSDAVIVKVVQLDPLLIVFSVPLAKRNEVHSQQKVQVLIGTEGKIAEGIVEFASPTADSSNTAIRVKVRLPNSENQWQAGERAVLLLDKEKTPNVQSVSPLAKHDP